MEQDQATEVRSCSKCGIAKPLDLFVKLSGGRRGTTCKRCHADNQNARWHALNPEAQTAAERYETTPELLAARLEHQRASAQRRQEAYRRRKGMPVRRIGRDPEKVAAARLRQNERKRTGPRKPGMTRDERLARRRANEAEKARNRETMRRKRRENPEAVRAAERANKRRWYAANTEQARAKGVREAQRRRARLAGADVRVVTQRDLDHQSVIQGHRCYWCHEPSTLTVDHVIPIARGGRHAIGNLVLACETCNKARCDALPAEWRLFRSRCVRSRIRSKVEA